MNGNEFPRLMKGLCVGLAILIILGVFVIVAQNSNNKFDTTNYHTKTIKIEKGDTLWELGSFCKSPDDDVRDWIKAVKELNGMSSSGLVAGDYIIIYVYN